MKPRKAKPRVGKPEVLERAEREIEQLKREVEGGSVEATEELIDLGNNIAAYLEQAYHQNPNLVSAGAERGDEFPIGYTWRKDINQRRLTYARSLPLARKQPFHTKGRLDEAFHEIKERVWRELERIRVSGTKSQSATQRDIIRQIRRLRPISIAGAKQWAEAFARYHVDFSDAPQLDSGNFFYRFANPERDVGIRRRRAKARLRARYGPDANVNDLDPIAATKRQKWLERINRMQVTVSSFRTRLAEVVEARLRRMIRE